MDQTLDRIPGTSYRILQYKERFRYGIDAILLSWYAKADPKDTVIDLCSGTGIVAMRHAAIYRPKKTWAIELQEDTAALCARSVRDNQLQERMECLQGDFTAHAGHFAAGSVDVVMANPPYIRKGHGEPSPDPYFAMARHEITMTLSDLFDFSRRVLKSGGWFYLIHRPGRLGEICKEASEHHLPVKQVLPVVSHPGEDPQLVLLACRKDGKPDLVLKSPLIVYEGSRYTKRLKAIYEGEKR